MLANHYLEAYRATSPGSEAEALAAQARVSLRGAADRALALHSHKQALSYLEQAIAVTTDRAELVLLHERAADSAMQHGLFETAMVHARAVETLSRDAGDKLGALRGVTLQAGVHMSEHAERPAIALLQPALQEVGELGSTQEVVSAQAELARALMIGGAADEAVAWADRVLEAAGVATDDQLLEALITKGTALTNTERLWEGEVVLRGAIDVAERSGRIWSALRARNNLLGVVSGDDMAAAGALLADSYTIAERYGLRTWAYQFAHAALTNAFERGDWEAWVDQAKALDATGFYGAWRILENAERAGYRGNSEEAEEQLAIAKGMLGTGSSQGVTGTAGVEAGIRLTAGDMPGVLPHARRAWAHQDSADYAVIVAMAAAVAANETDWAREARTALRSVVRRGRQADGQRATADTAVAILEERWSDARSDYLAARRLLTESNSLFWLGILDLMVGTRGEGRLVK